MDSLNATPDAPHVLAIILILVVVSMLWGLVADPIGAWLWRRQKETR